MNLRDLDLLLPLLSLELFTVEFVYISRFFYFINNDTDFYKNWSSKSLKITIFTNQQWKSDELKKSKISITTDLNFTYAQFLQSFLFIIDNKNFH